jgi:putative transposase
MSHTFANVVVHVIFGTKGRRPAIDDSFRLQLFEYMGGIVRNEIGQALIIGGTGNHVHGLLSIGTDISIGQAMSKLKSLSSGWVHKTFASAAGFAWQSGYGVFSVSCSKVREVEKYISRQEEHHRTISFEDEFQTFLQRHGVQFDPARIWD